MSYVVADVGKRKISNASCLIAVKTAQRHSFEHYGENSEIGFRGYTSYVAHFIEDEESVVEWAGAKPIIHEFFLVQFKEDRNLL